MFRGDRDVDGSGVTNGERAERAQAALDAYIQHTGDRPDESHFSDLLCDLMHLMDRDLSTKERGDTSFDQELERGRRNYMEER